MDKTPKWLSEPSRVVLGRLDKSMPHTHTVQMQLHQKVFLPGWTDLSSASLTSGSPCSVSNTSERPPVKISINSL